MPQCSKVAAAKKKLCLPPLPKQGQKKGKTKGKKERKKENKRKEKAPS